MKAALSASNKSFTCNTFKNAMDELQKHKKVMERLWPLEKEKGMDTILVNPSADLGELSPAGALHSAQSTGMHAHKSVWYSTNLNTLSLHLSRKEPRVERIRVTTKL